MMSPEVEEAMRGLLKYMFKNLYHNPKAKREEKKAEELLERLFEYYRKHPQKMPEQFTDMIKQGERLDRTVCDYIAGMTDLYAITKFNEYYVPVPWQT